MAKSEKRTVESSGDGDLIDPRGWKFSLRGYAAKYDYDKVLKRLGRVPDRVLADEIGCPIRSVARLRRQIGVAPFRENLRETLKPYLGRVPDRRLARKYGCTPATVANHRKALGIPPAKKSKAHAADLLREYIKNLES